MDVGNIPKYIDFGSAALISATHRQQYFTDGYAAPEIIKQGHRSSAADVFSLGRVFFFLCAEVRPLPFTTKIGETNIREDLRFLQPLIAHMTRHERCRRPKLEDAIGFIRQCAISRYFG
jgi:serine/threonine protein kinase